MIKERPVHVPAFFLKCLIVLARKNLQFVFITVGVCKVMKVLFKSPLSFSPPLRIYSF